MFRIKIWKVEKSFLTVSEYNAWLENEVNVAKQLTDQKKKEYLEAKKYYKELVRALGEKENETSPAKKIES